MGHPEVVVRQPGRRPLSIVVREPLDIGRDCDGLLLADPGASRRHARLEPNADHLVIVDLGSTNGTVVNGRRITAPTPLRGTDLAVIGETELLLVDPDPDPDPAAEADPGPAVRVEEAPDPSATVAGGAVPEAPSSPVIDPANSSIIKIADLARRARPEGLRDGSDGNTSTIAFSDIESSTERALRLGDNRWYDVLAIHNSIVRSNLLRHGGREVKSQGDGFMLTFPSARRGLHFAVDVQRAMTRWAEGQPDEGVRIRMGLHTGEALLSEDGDLFGKHVIVAARIANLADGGEVLVSGVTREIASNRSDVTYGEGRSVALKGIETPYTVFPLDWQA